MKWQVLNSVNHGGDPIENYGDIFDCSEPPNPIVDDAFIPLHIAEQIVEAHNQCIN